MPKAQVLHELGAPEVMKWQEWDVPDPAPGEVRLRHTAVGVNFADTYHRGGISHPWPVPPCPVVIGLIPFSFLDPASQRARALISLLHQEVQVGPDFLDRAIGHVAGVVGGGFPQLAVQQLHPLVHVLLSLAELIECGPLPLRLLVLVFAFLSGGLHL